MTRQRIYVPRDAAALSVGADETGAGDRACRGAPQRRCRARAQRFAWTAVAGTPRRGRDCGWSHRLRSGHGGRCGGAVRGRLVAGRSAERARPCVAPGRRRRDPVFQASAAAHVCALWPDRSVEPRRIPRARWLSRSRERDRAWAACGRRAGHGIGPAWAWRRGVPGRDQVEHRARERPPTRNTSPATRTKAIPAPSPIA